MIRRTMMDIANRSESQKCYCEIISEDIGITPSGCICNVPRHTQGSETPYSVDTKGIYPYISANKRGSVDGTGKGFIPAATAVNIIERTRSDMNKLLDSVIVQLRRFVAAYMHTLHA